MSQSGPPAEAKQAQAAAMAELESAQRRKRAIDGTLANLEASIWAFEGSYLDETAASGGNIIKGFDNYLKPPGTQKQKKADTSEVDRLFSTSSVTFRQSLAERNIQLMAPPRAVTTCLKPMTSLVADFHPEPRNASSSSSSSAGVRDRYTTMPPPPLPPHMREAYAKPTMPVTARVSGAMPTGSAKANRGLATTPTTSALTTPNPITPAAPAPLPFLLNEEQTQNIVANLASYSSEELQAICAQLARQGFDLPGFGAPAASGSGSGSASAANDTANGTTMDLDPAGPATESVPGLPSASIAVGSDAVGLPAPDAVAPSNDAMRQMLTTSVAEALSHPLPATGSKNPALALAPSSPDPIGSAPHSPSLSPLSPSTPTPDMASPSGSGSGVASGSQGKAKRAPKKKRSVAFADDDVRKSARRRG